MNGEIELLLLSRRKVRFAKGAKDAIESDEELHSGEP